MSDDAGRPGLREARARERTLRGALLAVAVSQLGLGLWMAASPGTFFRIAGFGARNNHYVNAKARRELSWEPRHLRWRRGCREALG